MVALRSVGKERCVVHPERIESALSKKGCILLVRGGLQRITEQIERNIRVKGGSTGSAAETLVWQPSPARAVVREGKVRRLAWSSAKFTGQARGVRRKIGESDALNSFGYNNPAWRKALERIVEAHCLVRDEFDEDVSRKDLCERTKPQHRILSGKLMGIRRGLAVPPEKDLIVANDDKNHPGGA